MWKDVNYFEGYQVNELGDVRNVVSGKLLKQYPQKSGYVNVWLQRGGNSISVPLHRIVCIAFNGEDGYIKGLYVDHINTDRSDNRAENLRWVTPKENSNNPITRENVRRMLENKKSPKVD